MTFVRRHAGRCARAGCVSALLLCVSAAAAWAAPQWATKFDGRVRFYQTTDFGVLLVGTEKSLYAVAGESGEVLWRRKNVRLDESDVAAVPGTDIVLLSFEHDDKTRLEAADLLTGATLWRSDKVRGAVLQVAFEPESNLLAVVCVRDAQGEPRAGFKRRPVVHVFDLGAGRELWKQDLESKIELMPTSWPADGEVSYTLDNYRPPAFLDRRLYLFYEGVTSLDAQTGRAREREQFRVNEEGLALTEADPVVDERNLYVSGHGRVRAVSRATGETVWEAKDLGLTPELILTRAVLYVRTGGQFTRLRDGATVARGPYGVSAIDVSNGKVLWRYKGADKGITNLVLPDAGTVVTADRDDLIVLAAATGKRRTKITHDVQQAAFVILNERGAAVVGGPNEVAAFALDTGRAVWRARHDPPGRGLLRTVAAVAARAASLYFRYGGAATTVVRGLQLANAVNSLRLSSLATNVASANLTSLATDYARARVRERFTAFGVLARAQQTGATVRQPPLPRPTLDVEDRLLDRLDPARQLERLAQFLWHRRRLAALRGQWMYFYTDLRAGRGLAGVNTDTGATARAIRLNDPDERFISDEALNLLYVSQDERLLALALEGND